MNTLLKSLRDLSDQRLTAQLIRHARHQREGTAILVAHLAEFGARKLYLAKGCATLFTYCTEVLHLSEHEAYLRITAARLSRRFPIVVDKLHDGTINLTTLKLLRKVLTPENHLEVLAAADHKRKGDIEELVAKLAPKPAVQNWIRKLPTPARVPAAVAQNLVPEIGFANASAVLQFAESPTVASPLVVATKRPAVIEPLAPEIYKIQITASAETHDKLREAQELLRNQIPDGDPAAVIDRALTMLVAHLKKTKLGATDKPRDVRPTRPGSRHIPAAVKRAVWKRDGGRCTFVSADGKRCSERGLLEWHHDHPHGDGGEATVENIQLRCRAHNQYEADLYFGPDNERVRNAAIQERKRQTGDKVIRELPTPYGNPKFGPDRIFTAPEVRPLTRGAGGALGDALGGSRGGALGDAPGESRGGALGDAPGESRDGSLGGSVSAWEKSRYVGGAGASYLRAGRRPGVN